MKDDLKERGISLVILLVVFGGWFLLGEIGVRVHLVIPIFLALDLWAARHVWHLVGRNGKTSD